MALSVLPGGVLTKEAAGLCGCYTFSPRSAFSIKERQNWSERLMILMRVSVVMVIRPPTTIPESSHGASRWRSV
jgi:hypothetical protein